MKRNHEKIWKENSNKTNWQWRSVKGGPVGEKDDTHHKSRKSPRANALAPARKTLHRAKLYAGGAAAASPSLPAASPLNNGWKYRPNALLSKLNGGIRKHVVANEVGTEQLEDER